MANILVLFTGGTIGSRITTGGNIGLERAEDRVLLRLYRQTCGEAHHFSVAEPYCVLSENMHAGYWNKLIAALDGVNTENLDGIIITHGSDTLSYTAALIGYAFRHTNIPIVLIASDYVLDDPRSNGLANFASAVDLITSGVFSGGVFVCYQNKAGEHSVYLPTRLCEADPYLDAFHSFDGIRLGSTENGRFLYEQNPLNPTVLEINTPRDRLLPERPFSMTDSVLLLRSYPGLDYDRIDLTGTAAVLNVGYHSATVCAEDVGGCSFARFARRCAENGTDLYLSSFKREDGRLYESLAGLLAHAKIGKFVNTSPEAAYMKLILAYSLPVGNRKQLLKSDLYFETVKTPD